ncbi:D-inositol-3-phosphate glycosyltransferase [Paraburkholderia nemoris]|uniref:glycosyltransferase n=1 Tax=Paraburkholderia nemoris TaxID=2793076 RepID=UPI001B0B5C1D|nr:MULTISPECIES: glycosyltransferase [Paraburkholderia]CAE6864606.1 D-inositol-3-phosphate glycosyltransferase [Paraburkholderia nemoris]
MMRIVIDLQGAQAENKNRGIGRYTLSLAKAIVRNAGQHEVFLVLNGQFPETIESIRAAFEGLLPQTHVRVWYAPGPVNNLDADNEWRRKGAELVREAFIADLKPDMVLVSSLFEGLTDSAVTSIGSLSNNVPTAVILYDLIPLINRDLYLGNPVVEKWYENKIDHLRRANLVLAISESSRQEGIRCLGFSAVQAVNISTAADAQFLPQQIGEKKEIGLRKRYGLHRPFVMYTGGIDHRKNIEGLIRGYARIGKALRARHQLAIVCSIQPASRAELEALAEQVGLGDDELVLTGFVPEEDLIALYNLCKAFVFPSWHEGFGLPALEAMCCGRAVIAAETSSLPEVLGREDALFDPHDDNAIANKLEQVLVNDKFRRELEQHGLKQAESFSWDSSAKAALSAIETWHSSQSACAPQPSIGNHRPKLAYVSPLPPERTGISDYSAELLPELARHYEIDVVVDQESISDPWIRANCPVRTVDWFKKHADRYDRVLYHFGNSPFHKHMFGLIDQIPGVVVLHDFFLGHATEYVGAVSGNGNVWPSTLYEEYGYPVLKDRFNGDVSRVAWKYPANRRVIEKALGVIVHSESSKKLAELWHGERSADDWAIIPLLRVAALNIDRISARNELALDPDAFVVCSFGMLGRNKSNHRLLDSWLASPLAKSDKCVLVFVGQNDAGEYGSQLLEKIASSGVRARIRITGWADTATFKRYMMASDVGVQLRTLSRGETSAAVLDCMNFGLPTIVNAHGSNVDLPGNSVWKIPDEFEDAQLSQALETLWRSASKRQQLGETAREIVQTLHAPRLCTDQYAVEIERAYRLATTNLDVLTERVAKADPRLVAQGPLKELAYALAKSFQPKLKTRQLLVDVSELAQRDSKTGIQRVVRSVLLELLTNPPDGYRVEPVHAVPGIGYCYARTFTLRFLGYPDCFLNDEVVEFDNGDLFLGLDLQHYVVRDQVPFYQEMRNQGVQVHFVVYDLLPILLSRAFVPGAAELHHDWLKTLACCDGIICISRAVADEMVDWLKINGPTRLLPLKVGYFHLGGDIAASTPSKDLPADAESVLREIASRPSFLMVGTVEPRKGHTQTLAAFERLWAKGATVCLVIVGKQGWVMDGLAASLRNHPKLGKQLFWLEGVSDQYLERVYAASTCLIAASEGEGFGLPLIEAAQHKLPIIARDLPVFCEVAGEHAYYFSGLQASALSEAVEQWLSLYKANKAPCSDEMPWLTWAQSTEQLLDVLLNGKWMTDWMPDGGHRYVGADARLGTQVGTRVGQIVQTDGRQGYLLYGPYLTLSAGLYQIRIRGQVKALGTPAAYVDAAVRKGSEVLVSQPLATSTDGQLLLDMKISIETAVTDFEIRVWVPADADLIVKQLDILPESVFSEEPSARKDKMIDCAARDSAEASLALAEE